METQTKRFKWIKKISNPTINRLINIPKDLWFYWGMPEYVVIEWTHGEEYAVIRPASNEDVEEE